MDFYVGQKVVCVDAECTNIFGEPELEEGRIYDVRWVGALGNNSRFVVEHPRYDRRGLCVKLSGIIRCSGNDVPFAAARFRPLRETNIDIFLQILEPTREVVDA